MAVALGVYMMLKVEAEDLAVIKKMQEYFVNYIIKFLILKQNLVKDLNQNQN